MRPSASMYSALLIAPSLILANHPNPLNSSDKPLSPSNPVSGKIVTVSLANDADHSTGSIPSPESTSEPTSPRSLHKRQFWGDNFYPTPMYTFKNPMAPQIMPIGQPRPVVYPRPAVYPAPVMRGPVVYPAPMMRGPVVRAVPRFGAYSNGMRVMTPRMAPVMMPAVNRPMTPTMNMPPVSPMAGLMGPGRISPPMGPGAPLAGPGAIAPGMGVPMPPGGGMGSPGPMIPGVMPMGSAGQPIMPPVPRTSMDNSAFGPQNRTKTIVIICCSIGGGLLLLALLYVFFRHRLPAWMRGGGKSRTVTKRASTLLPVVQPSASVATTSKVSDQSKSPARGTISRPPSIFTGSGGTKTLISKLKGSKSQVIGTNDTECRTYFDGRETKIISSDELTLPAMPTPSGGPDLIVHSEYAVARGYIPVYGDKFDEVEVCEGETVHIRDILPDGWVRVSTSRQLNGLIPVICVGDLIRN